MSLSRRSSRSELPRPAGRCPTCGSARVIRTEEDVVLPVGRRRHRFENVVHERCLACGERIFDVEVSRRFDAVILKRKRQCAA